MANENIILAIIAAGPPFLMAVAAFWQGKKNGKAAEKIQADTTQIHLLVNSNLAKVTTDLAAANEKIVDMHKLIAHMVEREEGLPASGVAKAAEDTVNAAIKTYEA